jgi:alpha-D-ribose 1-methylphosphonate 5-triphosphate synthase subunit PhnG
MNGKNLKERLQGISQVLDENAFLDMHKMVLSTGAQFIRPAETGLLMMQLKDTFDTDFYLGEVLITEAMADIDGKRGYAMTVGDCPVKTEVLAGIEAIEKNSSEYAETIAEIEKKIEFLESKAGETIKKESAFISSTRVNFEIMKKG